MSNQDPDVTYLCDYQSNFRKMITYQRKFRKVVEPGAGLHNKMDVRLVYLFGYQRKFRELLTCVNSVILSNQISGLHNEMNEVYFCDYQRKFRE